MYSIVQFPCVVNAKKWHDHFIGPNDILQELYSSDQYHSIRNPMVHKSINFPKLFYFRQKFYPVWQTISKLYSNYLYRFTDYNLDHLTINIFNGQPYIILKYLTTILNIAVSWIDTTIVKEVSTNFWQTIWKDYRHLGHFSCFWRVFWLSGPVQ